MKSSILNPHLPDSKPLATIPPTSKKINREQSVKIPMFTELKKTLLRI
jgi:hypothetical protein